MSLPLTLVLVASPGIGDIILNVVRRRENLERVRKFFHWAARRSFWDLDIRESRVTDYIADVLTNFVRTENLYPFRNQRGERLETIAEMLLEANLITLSGGTLQREREIRKHIGDYVLFMAGIFPEYIKRRSLFDYYLEEGAKAYWSVSELDRALLRPGAMLFQELASRFELYVGALNYMRKAFFRDTLGDPYSFGSSVRKLIL